MNPVDSMARFPLRWLIGALGLAVLLSMTFTVVPETQQGLILRYGEIQRVVNRYSNNESFGRTGAGLAFRVPFVEQIQLIDKRVLGVNLDNQQVLSSDQLPLQVDAYARFRINNPEQMYRSVRTVDALQRQLSSLLASRLRNELGRRNFATLLSPERNRMMGNIQSALSREARRYGAQVIDVRINRAELPVGTPRDSTYERMRTARAEQAATITADGDRQAQLIRADASAEAARIYADSFGKDPGFYAFYRAMQSYRQTFRGQGAGETSFVLPPGEGYLSEFGGRGGGG
jgi:modulator of FtsH protease HflC